MRGKVISIHFLKVSLFQVWMSYYQMMGNPLQGHMGKENLRLSTGVRVFDCVGDRTL